MTDEQYRLMLAARKDRLRNTSTRPLHGILNLEEIANGEK